MSEIIEGFGNLGRKKFGKPNPEVEKEAARRKAICDICQPKNKIRCEACGCLLAAKVRSMKSTCPKKKW
jgi:hypothetical protein